MRILAVNVRAGGSLSSAGAMISRFNYHAPDAIVLSEFRDNAVGAYLREQLRAAGFQHQGATEGHRGNGVLIAAALPFEAVRNPFGLPDDEYPDAVVLARFEHLRLFGVYLPGQDRKRPHLRYLIATAKRYNEESLRGICIGDFNSGRNETDIEANLGRRTLADEFSTADLYAELEQYWTEAWLHEHPGRLDFSWYPYRKVPPARQRNGWRIDKAFVSNALLPSLRSAEYDHEFRLAGLTDHSGLVVDLAPALRQAQGDT